MIRIDDTFLADVGLRELPARERPGFLSYVYETLEMRVGIRLADLMTNDQLDEFESYFEAKDDKGAFLWLEQNFPSYKEIVAAEFAALKQEVTANAEAILAAVAEKGNPGAGG